MSSSNSESASQRSSDEDERAENGHEDNGHEENGHEENGNVNENGASAPWRASDRAVKSLALAFPISRVRRLVKSGADTQWVGAEAGFLVAKAAEIFLEKMVEDAFDRMLEKRQHAILYPHLSTHVASSDRLEFLTDFVPTKIPGATALANIKMANQ